MMTLGPIIALIPLLEKVNSWVGRTLMVFGRVAFFYYLLHILVIHVSALVVQAFLFGGTHSEWYGYAPYVNVPEASQWSLSLLYLVFAIDVVILFFACRWYDRYKTIHPERKWLRYI
jgi:hypothetical protein